jgi:hypothetical protein
VDGEASLGWGLAESDFYPMSQAETLAGLAQIQSNHPHLWHYRLYDTVSDPNGVIRHWLAENADLRLDQPYPGRDFLRLQQWGVGIGDSGLVTGDWGAGSENWGLESPNLPISQSTIPTTQSPNLIISPTFWQLPNHLRQGETAYISLGLRGGEALAGHSGEIRSSLRLYATVETPLGAHPVLASQADETVWSPGQGIGDWVVNLALPVPASLPPGNYELALLLYRGEDGSPIPLPTGDGKRVEQLVLNPSAAVMAGDRPIDLIAPPLARFDYIELLHAQASRDMIGEQAVVRLSLIWRPRPNVYADSYDAILALVERTTQRTVGEWRTPLGSHAYPSGDWAADWPVAQWSILPLADAGGEYGIRLRVERSSDGLPIPARTGPWPWQAQEWVVVGN